MRENGKKVEEAQQKSRQEEVCKMLGDNDTIANFKNLIQPKPKDAQKS